MQIKLDRHKLSRDVDPLRRIVEPNPYTSSEDATASQSPRAAIPISTPVAITLGIVLGGVAGLVLFILAGLAIEEWMVPMMFDPDEPFTSYGQAFALGFAPLAGIFGAGIGFVVSLAPCPKTVNKKQPLYLAAVLALVITAFAATPLVTRFDRPTLVINGSFLALGLFAILIALVALPFASVSNRTSV